MAVDLTDKAQNIASKTIIAAERMLDSFNELADLEAERAASGIDLTQYDAKYLDGSNKHVNGAMLNAVLNTSAPAIWDFITTNFHDDNLQKLRP